MEGANFLNPDATDPNVFKGQTPVNTASRHRSDTTDDCVAKNKCPLSPSPRHDAGGTQAASKKDPSLPSTDQFS